MPSPLSWRAWEKWLLAQRQRQDPVGDLARDWADDLADDCATGIRTLSGMDRHLRLEHDADDRVLAARDRAYREYRGQLQ